MMHINEIDAILRKGKEMARKAKEIREAKRIKLTWMNTNTGLYNRSDVDNLWYRIDIHHAPIGYTNEGMLELSLEKGYTMEIVNLPEFTFDNDKWSN